MAEKLRTKARQSLQAVRAHRIEKVFRKPGKTKLNIILTGSTGSLGAYLLNDLLSENRVEKVTCLNRTDDAQERQRANHTSRGLSTDFEPTRVEFLQCDLSIPGLGFSEVTYQHLASEVTHILHNAWPVDFNRHLSSFEPHIRGVRHLIDFSHRCTHDATIFFVSSISAAARWGTLPGALAKVPEMVLDDWRLAKMGYGQSKLVSERLLSQASLVSGIRTAVCRVGQVAGPVMRGTQGVWNKQEWLPSLIASSQFLGKIPKTLGPVNSVDWVPVDWLAQIIIELLLEQSPEHSSSLVNEKECKNETAVYHVVNPNPVPWTSLLNTTTQHLGRSVSVVSFPEWVDELELSAAGAAAEQQDAGKNPASKLLPFFDDLRDKALRFPRTQAATLDTKQTVLCSKSLAILEKVTPEWMQLWMKQWAFQYADGEKGQVRDREAKDGEPKKRDSKESGAKDGDATELHLGKFPWEWPDRSRSMIAIE